MRIALLPLIPVMVLMFGAFAIDYRDWKRGWLGYRVLLVDLFAISFLGIGTITIVLFF